MGTLADWVIFDLDGTLIESEQVWGDVRREFVLANGGNWEPGAQSAMIGMRTAEWANYMHEELGVALPPDEIARRVVDAVAQRLRDPPILPDADAALKALASAFQLGLASSASLPTVQTVLSATGWDKLFEVVVSADQVPRGKPAPDVYLRALELLGSDPLRTAAVEDSASGIRSAYAAGLAVIAIPNREYPPNADALSLASRILSHLASLDATVIREVLSAPRRSRA
jgi:HAD superfamily hydrolase (TIGR01509 family)